MRRDDGSLTLLEREAKADCTAVNGAHGHIHTVGDMFLEGGEEIATGSVPQDDSWRRR